MASRPRLHVNPLAAHFAEFRGRRPTLVPGRPVELEVGCADAQFLFERARQDPARCYVGVEIREPMVELVNRRAAAEGAPVQAVFCHAMHLRTVLPAGACDRVYVNFPDPCFKLRQRKRRMIDDQLAADCAHLLRPGGELLVQSDVWDVALDALAIFEARDDLYQNHAGPWSFWKTGNPYGIQSLREQRVLEKNLPVWRIWYTRRKA